MLLQIDYYHIAEKLILMSLSLKIEYDCACMHVVYLKLLISPWKRDFTSGITKWITACMALVMNSENFTGLNLSSGGT